MEHSNSILRPQRILLVLGVNFNTMVFKDVFLQLYPSTVLLQQCDGYPSLNERQQLDFVKSVKPDLIVSYGPERLSAEFINSARLGGINAHWGLTPMYRGMHTARFALLQVKPEWVGITIHMLEPTLDTGAIIYQAKPDLKKGDSYKMIEARLNLLVCEIMPKAVEAVLNGTANAIPQDKDVGKQYMAREWTEEYEKALTPRFIELLLEYYLSDKGHRDKRVKLINDYFTLPRD